MKSNSITIGAIVSLVLVAVVAVLYWIASSNDGENYREGISTIRKTQQLASNWSIEAVRVKSDPLADFDSLAAFIPRMDRLKEDLSNAMLRMPDIPERLANEISAYASELDAKEERIERFKTGYAVIRNSIRYLPLAATGVVQQAQEVDNAAVAQNITRLTDEINSYLATPSEPEKERLVLALEDLRDASIAHPPPLANAIANFISHAQVLLDKQAPTEEIFREATSDSISNLTEKLTNSLEFELNKKRTLATYSERGILVAVAALLMLWVVLALRRTRDGAVEVQAAATGEVVSPQAAIAVQETQLVQLSADLVAADDEDKVFGVSTTAGSIMLHKMLAGMVANNLATSAHRINTSMDILNEIQGKIQNALDRSERAFASHNGGEPVEAIKKLGTELQEINTRSHLDAASTVVSSVQNQAKNITDLAERLTSFSRKQDGIAYGLVDVNDCVDEVIETTRVDTVTSVVKHLGNIPEIFASKTEVCLMLANVIENSALAIQELNREKGVIKIETARENGQVLITITDNGGGIAPERRKKIFNLFYTSRDNGMGIGLASTNYLVKKYEGTISVNSLSGEGTAIRITLPAGTASP